MENLIHELNDYIKNNNKIIECKLGKLVLQKQIGQGGNALVYSAHFLGKW